LEQREYGLSEYKFSAAQRYAVFTVHRERCWLCDEPLSLSEMTVDHILPEAIDGSEQLARTVTLLGLPADFKINSYENWMPAHRRCNEIKGQTIFSPSPLIQTRLESAIKNAAKAREIEQKFVSKRKIDRAIELIIAAHERDLLSNSSRNRLRVLENEVVSFHESNRSPEQSGKPLLLAPWLKIIREDTSGLLLQGPAGVGRRPHGENLHPSWDCPRCGPTGWNGVRCVSCGMMDDGD
jgi:hypothetical protein